MGYTKPLNLKVRLPTSNPSYNLRLIIFLAVSGQHKVDTTHKSTLPSTEEPSTSPVGVGSLPGDIHEQGVAQLPDEPERKRSLGITGATDPGVGTHPHAYNFTESDLPSHGAGLSGEPVGGVGSLPGDVGEEGVGFLPDERAASGQSKSLQEDLQEQKQRGEEFDERRGQAIAIGVGGVSAAKPVEKDKKGRPGAGETRRSEGEITKSREAALGAPVRKERRASEGAAKGMEGGVGDEAKKSERTKEDQAMAAGVGAAAAAGAAAVVGGRALGGKDNEGKKELGNEGGAKPQGEKKSGGPGESNQVS